jgi:hypothetical protein
MAAAAAGDSRRLALAVIDGGHKEAVFGIGIMATCRDRRPPMAVQSLCGERARLAPVEEFFALDP